MNPSKERDSWPKAALETAALWLVVIVTLFNLGLAINEADTMAYALHAAVPSWLQNDWYLTREVGYRWLFNLLFGNLMHLLGATSGIVIGRLVSYALFAFACQRLMRAARVPFALGVAVVYWYVNYPSIAAGEWMVGGLEAKAFAWPFALLSIAALLRERWRWCWLCLGAALSFHVLVGVYTGYALILTVLVMRGRRSFGALDGTWAFLITGVPGLFSVASHLFQRTAGASEGWRVYVEFRLPHHCIPDWSLSAWTELLALGLVNIFFYWRSNHVPSRNLAAIALAWLSLTAVGILIHASGEIDLLRFYWFRMADAALRLLTLFAAVGHFREQLWAHRTIQRARGLTLTGCAAVLALILYVERPLPLAILGDEPLNTIWERNSVFDPPMARWIKENTAAHDVFLVPPGRDDFYFSLERPLVATFKYFPQSAADVTEWYARMEVLNGGSPIEGTGLEARTRIAQGYRALDRTRLEAISRRYEASFYLTDIRDRTDLPVAYRTDRFALYRIPTAVQ